MTAVAPWTTADMPSLVGKTAVVTGANAGLGTAITAALLAAGAEVVMACRSVERGRDALDGMLPTSDPARDRADVAALDLQRPESIESFADTFLAGGGGLDLLINNAGIMACPPRLTAEGIESQWATNHLGHFALTGRLLPAFIDRPARVVSVSSLAAAGGSLDGHDPTDLTDYSRFGAYSNTKLANQVFAVELNHRLRDAGSPAVSVAAHPGVSHTRLTTSSGLGRLTPAVLALSRLVTQSANDGALPILQAATDPEVEGGQYYGPAGRGQRRGAAKQVLLVPGAANRSTGRRLWEQSVALSGVDYAALD